MRPSPNLMLTAAVVVAAAGLGALALSRSGDAHVVTVRLGDGAVEQIRYFGDAPPRIVLDAAPGPLSGPVAVGWPAAAAFESVAPFADLDRISALMDRQAAMMLVQARAAEAADLSSAPLPGRGYSLVATVSGDGVCTRTTHYESFDDGRPPKVQVRISGPCGAQARPEAPTATPAPAEHGRPAVLQTAYRPRGAPEALQASL